MKSSSSPRALKFTLCLSPVDINELIRLLSCRSSSSCEKHNNRDRDGEAPGEQPWGPGCSNSSIGPHSYSTLRAPEPGALCNQNNQDQMFSGPLCSHEFLVSTRSQKGTEMSLGPSRQTGSTRSTDTAVSEPSQEPVGPQAQGKLREKPTMPRPNTEKNSLCQFPLARKACPPWRTLGEHLLPLTPDTLSALLGHYLRMNRNTVPIWEKPLRVLRSTVKGYKGNLTHWI